MRHSDELVEHLLEHSKPRTLGELRDWLTARRATAKGIVRDGELVVLAIPKEAHDGP
jgi:hypothetical protein